MFFLHRLSYATARTFALFWLLAGTAVAGPVPRIIGGTDAGTSEFPFMAALVRPSGENPIFESDRQAQFCGGTVVGERWILTAAHCVREIYPYQVEVIAGITTLADLPPYANRISVHSIIVHPQYNPDSLANDIALLYLNTPLVGIPAVSIDNGSRLALLEDGADITAIGWGTINQGVLSDPNDDSYSATLQKAPLDYLSRASCYAFYPGELNSNSFCAGFHGTFPRDTCFGDSGGPLLLANGGGQWQQIGVTSYGANDNCASGIPAVYVGAGAYRDFILGAQSQADLQLYFSTANFDLAGTEREITMQVLNTSPIHTATGTVLTVTLTGDIHVNQSHGYQDCSVDAQGVSAARIVVYSCPLGDMSNAGMHSNDMRITLNGSSLHRMTAQVSSVSGDYFPANNSDGFDDTPAVNNIASGSDDDDTVTAIALTLLGSWTMAAVFPLFLLALRRRHAPHHSLRLRQFLRIG